MRSEVALGLDFGTESVRALLLEAESGREIATSTAAYRHGVLSHALPGGRPLPAEWALQDPSDWLDAFERVVQQVLADASVPGEVVAGIGVDFTSCTVLPTTAVGTPLCQVEEFVDEPHAWPKLWKHHAAHRQAEELTAHLARSDAPRLVRYGGRISSEWLIPKAMQMVDEAGSVFEATERIVEGSDWLTWQLCGVLVRNSCAAGFKALWNKRDGYPSARVLGNVRPELSDLFDGRAGGTIATPGAPVGVLRAEWADRLGLSPDLVVAASIVDAHSGLLGAGLSEPGTLYLATGTSTCHLLLAPQERMIEGISGVVEDGILVGLYAYEAGQASVGDMFDWYASLVGRSHQELTARAKALRPGQSGLLALDWWNGCRTPLVDADLSGTILGATLATPPEALYRALLEATAFGTRLVIDTFAAGGVPLDRLVVGGGLVANELVLQIYADVTGLPVEVVGSRQPSARGAAILGAAAAGIHGNVAAATNATASQPVAVLEPSDDAREAYDALYGIYREVVTLYGALDSPLKRLSTLRRQVMSDRVPSPS